MGNNAAFTSFEASVIAVYNKGVLDKDLLDALAAPYEGSDIDRGGMTGDLSKDGLDIDDIILKTYGVELPPRPKLPNGGGVWTSAQREENDAWCDLQYDNLKVIQDGWGWR